ncbi:MAG: helix-turn-helix transcriptional regulator [Ruminococcaceae bacterium]|nr:helix-turn-helix transcriptional regulator [Oscillospiraceae bacterium]
MKRLQKISITSILKQIKAEGVSMRRRFVMYIISAIALVLSLILLLLNLFGIMNPTNSRIMEVMDTQLLSYTDYIEHDYNEAAAHALSFSDQIEATVESFLVDNSIAFEDLKNNADALSELQCELYNTVYLNMQLAPTSGAFYILDTTVNGQSEPQLYNGIYLKYINLYSESTVNNDIALYRGSFSTAKEGNLTFHSGWNNEMRTDFFDSCKSEFSKGTYYILSPTVDIPDTWERARYIYTPIRDSRDHIIGVCGFEINNLYFQLSKKANDSKLGQLVGALLDEDQEGFSGQFNSNRYNTSGSDFVKVSKRNDATVFDFGEEKCIGKTQSIKLGNNTFTVALMMTESQYNAQIFKGQMKTAGIILFVVLVALTYCLFMSKKYVSPILKKIDQVKYSGDQGKQLKIREIDDLFEYLAQRDVAYEEQLINLQAAKLAAEEEAQRTKAAYEKALEEYELAQNEILQLTEDQKKKIVLEDYDYFICNLTTLTPTESRIYELYLEGKTVKEITTILGIQENTMKYHNKNIYGKLGVSSRKQLLRFAALKQQQDRKGYPNT